MKVNPNNIELIISAVKEDQYPETELSEVALSGRSNVGKSTFINSMIGRKNMARTEAAHENADRCFVTQRHGRR